MSPHWSNIFEGEKDLEASLNTKQAQTLKGVRAPKPVQN